MTTTGLIGILRRVECGVKNMALTDVFTYNQHFVAMMNVINAARLNPPESGHKHHIVPRCWFKMKNLPIDNSNDNLVLLTYEDHCKVHKLAYLCTTGKMKRNMAYAYHRLTGGELVTVNALKGVNCAIYGRRHTVEEKENLSRKLKGRPSPNKGKHPSEETRRKLSEANKGKKRPKRTPEHCRKLSESIKRTFGDPEHRRMNSERQKGHKWSNGSLGMHWYNNGKVNKFAYECPEGFVKGRLKNG